MLLDKVRCWNPETAPVKSLLTVPVAKPGQGTSPRRQYLDVIAAFDIETSKIQCSRLLDHANIQQSWMYVWQFAIGEKDCIFGRTWEELQNLIEQITRVLENKRIRLIVYVHNLSYEFQFLSGIFEFGPKDVFAIKSRQVLRADLTPNIELRCSSLLTGLTLDRFTHKMGVYHAKRDGEEFDYSVRRYSDTPLTRKQYYYCLCDVIGLVEAINEKMRRDGDTPATIPLTKTGYIRRRAKDAMLSVPYPVRKANTPNWSDYVMLREAFRGGDTHANRCIVDYKIPDVTSVDASSMYPFQMVTKRFPSGQWTDIDAADFDRIIFHIRHGRAVLMRALFVNIRLAKEDWPDPYIPRDKARNVYGGLYDNGRVLSADQLELTITEVDLKIILNEYKFDDIYIINAKFAKKSKLPKPLRDLIISLYLDKTQLKGVKGMEWQYAAAKEDINSSYGMMVTDPVKDVLIYLENDFIPEGRAGPELLAISNSHAFLNYAWGVYVTAYARQLLHEAITLIYKTPGATHCYNDTDSCKYHGSVDWQRFNQKLKKAAESAGMVAEDPNGITHYGGVFESEGTYEFFKTLGAKKYIYNYPGGPLQITIAGVNKSKGGPELEHMGGYDAFSLHSYDTTFHEAGGLEAVYNDVPIIDSINIDGREVPITKNVCLVESEYTLGTAADYERLITGLTLRTLYYNIVMGLNP